MNNVFTLLFLFVCLYSQAQTPDWVWARSASSGVSGVGEGIAIALDNLKNAYVTGTYLDTITFGPYTLISGNGCAYVAKYDSNGNIKWVKANTLGINTAYCEALNICTDRNANIYVTGDFTGSVSFDSFTLTSHGNFDIFLAKYDSSGNVLWAKNFGGTGPDKSFGVASDASGNVYITGGFSSQSVVFGSTTLLNSGVEDFFLSKFDSSGNVLWSKRAGGTVSDQGYSVTTDNAGKVYVTGLFNSSTASFGGITLTTAGSIDLFIAKYDSSGNVVWAKSVGGGGLDYGLCVAADLSMNIYVTGFYSSASLSFGGHIITNAGVDDGYIVKYDSSGQVLWVKNIGGTGTEYAYNVVCDRSGKPYVTGSTNSGSVTFDTVALQIPGGGHDPMYLAAFDSSGHGLWGKALASGGDDNSGVAVDSSGCIYIGGDFEYLNPFIIGHDSLPLHGIENVFITKLCENFLGSNFTASSTAICAEGNNCINFFDYSMGNPTSWQWYFTGAFPDTSSQQNPTNICYNTPGTYPVTLIVGNGTAFDTLIVASMIIVGGTPPLPVISVVGGDTLVCSPAAHYQWYLNGNIISGATDSFYVVNQNGTYSVQITDGYGCNALSAGVQVGVDEVNAGGGIVVYPNPANDQLAIGNWQLAKGAKVGVYNVLGEKIFEQNLSAGDRTVVDVKSLSPGVYYFVITTDERKLIGKFLKE